MTTVQLLLCGHACQHRGIFVNFHLRLQPIGFHMEMRVADESCNHFVLITDTVIFVTRYSVEWNV